jgi:hypothetical protein
MCERGILSIVVIITHLVKFFMFLLQKFQEATHDLCSRKTPARGCLYTLIWLVETSPCGCLPANQIEIVFIVVVVFSFFTMMDTGGKSALCHLCQLCQGFCTLELAGS